MEDNIRENPTVKKLIEHQAIHCEKIRANYGDGGLKNFLKSLDCETMEDLFDKVAAFYQKNKSDKIDIVAITMEDRDFPYKKGEEDCIYQFLPRPKALNDDFIIDVPSCVLKGAIGVMVPFYYNKIGGRHHYKATYKYIIYCDTFWEKVDLEKMRENNG